MLNLLHIRQFLDGLVIAASEPVHQTVFLAAGLDADNDFISLLPLMDVFRYHFHGVLEIRHHLNDAVSGDLEHSVIGELNWPKFRALSMALMRGLSAHRPRMISLVPSVESLSMNTSS